MKLNDLFNQIESVEFATQFSVISGFRVFQHALADNDTLKQLIQHLQKAPTHRQDVFQRMLTLLSADEISAELEHPHDIALAGYLYSLAQTDLTLAHRAADALLKADNLWWSRQLAASIVETAKAEPASYN